MIGCAKSTSLARCGVILRLAAARSPCPAIRAANIFSRAVGTKKNLILRCLRLSFLSRASIARSKPCIVREEETPAQYRRQRPCKDLLRVLYQLWDFPILFASAVEKVRDELVFLFRRTDT